MLTTIQSDAARSAHVRVLIFGGSQGAHAINVAVVEAAPRLARGSHAPPISRLPDRDAGLRHGQRGLSNGAACKAAWNGSSMRWTER